MGLTGPAGPQGITGPQGPMGPQGPAGPVIGAAASVASTAAQTFQPPAFGLVTFDATGALHGTALSPNRRNVIIETAGLYLIEYGVRASIGPPAVMTIGFAPGGYDNAGKIPLSPGAMVSGAIVRRLGAQTWLGLYVGAADNNTPVTIPAGDGFSNAYLNVTRVGPYPTETTAG